MTNPQPQPAARQPPAPPASRQQPQPQALKGWTPRAATGAMVNLQVFTESGLYAPTPGVASLMVECWGGGGGGGGAIVAAPFTAMGGGGGGSGGYSKSMLQASQVLGGVVVTIPTPAMYSYDYGSRGGTGGSTSFGALCVANGGHGGATAGPVASGSTSQTAGYGGAGAPAGVGDVAFPGNSGQTGGYALAEAVEVAGGLGGVAPGSGGVQSPASTLSGTGVVGIGPDGIGPGAGASGAASAQSGAQPTGGYGGYGLCVVTEYIFADGGAEESIPTFNVNARVKVAEAPPWPPRPPWHGPRPPGPGPWPPRPFEGEEPAIEGSYDEG